MQRRILIRSLSHPRQRPTGCEPSGRRDGPRLENAGSNADLLSADANSKSRSVGALSARAERWRIA
jgi:hypothetical protein